MGGIKVGTSYIQWIQTSVSQSPSSSQALASAISYPSSRRHSLHSVDGAVVCNHVKISPFYRAQAFKLYRTHAKARTPSICRALSGSLDSFSDEEFSKNLLELAMKFQTSDDEDSESSFVDSEEEPVPDCNGVGASLNAKMKIMEHGMPFDHLEPPDLYGRVETINASVAMKANSVELPVSLRMIKRKKQWSGALMVAKESAYCSVKKAFSSMVFIIRELQCFTLQMREVLYYEDLQGIVSRVQAEMHASFVWLFQQVFSCTPSLMVYVMILLANYSVHSMANSTGIAAAAVAAPPQAFAATMESISMVEDNSFGKQHKFDTSAIKSFSVSSSTGKTTSIGGSSGGGGNYKPVAGGTDGAGKFNGSISFDHHHHQNIVPDEVSSVRDPLARTSDEQSVSGQESREEELELWKKVVDEASCMQAAIRSEAFDHETLHGFVSPVNVKIEADDYADYFRTELLYQTELAQEPHNPLLLANYAQFLFLVAQDYGRAEEYFKMAVAVEPKDAEALNKYASFLWKVRNHLYAAEETYQEAVAAEPRNSFYAATYAHFLWNTGGDNTCYPLTSLTSNEGDIDI